MGIVTAWIHARADYVRASQLKQLRLVVALFALVALGVSWIHHNETLYWVSWVALGVIVAVDLLDRQRRSG